ncbi:unnamed protein product [Phytophthora fragariaefolia]|uniref:Vacuolar protein 8 n=1 Tax=Phytophthora fragariaefolia TaxID=1490495 RepID=A0A9W6XRE1_9STRA|nr:unnamed protein product [Phytophthora fragariaefolia]
MMDELRLINEEIDAVIRTLGLTNIEASNSWKQQYEDDKRTHQQLLASSVDNAQEVLAELLDAPSQQETMLTLKYEVGLPQQQQNTEMTKLLKSMMATVIRTSATSVPKLPPWFLPPYEIRFDSRPFARGSYSTVHRGVRESGESVVVKCFLADRIMDESIKQKIEAEITIWHQFDHPNIIKLFGASHISTPPFIVCEDAANGDLREFLARSDANKQQMWKLMYEAALGLQHIHKMSVVHGDLKLNNILVGADGQAKLSDFGMSAARTLPTPSENVGKWTCTPGALRWRAPECLKNPPTYASDVYSFAMCIIEAVIGEPPFAFLDDDSVKKKLRNGEIPQKPDEMSKEAWQLIIAMTNEDPYKRISLTRVLTTLKVFADAQSKSLPQLATVADGKSARTAKYAINFYEPLADAEIIVNILASVPGMDDRTKEASMLHLIRICIKDDERQVMYEANAIHTLIDLVISSESYFVKLYALQCLKWAAMVDAKLSKPEYDSLRETVSVIPVVELASVINTLRNGTDQEKEEAAIRCACISTRGNEGSIQRTVALLQPLVALWQGGNETQKLWVGMVQPLVSLLHDGNGTQRLWAAEAIANLAMENEAIRSEIVQTGAITPLVSLLRVGTHVQRHRASLALKNLALQNGVGEAIAQKKAIESVLGLLRLGTAQQQKTTTALLQSLILPSYTNRADIERETSIASLIALILIGSQDQKEAAAAVLANLAKHNKTHSEISSKGGISPLIDLLSTGTNTQQGSAASALMNLASSITVAAEISREGGVAPLIQLARNGNDQQKTYAVGALANLARDDTIGAEITRNEGITPIVELLRTGSTQQKDLAIGALKNLAINDQIRGEIAREGGVKPLLKLIKSGTDEQKESAAGALKNLSPNDEVRSKILKNKGTPALLELLCTGNDQQKERIAGALDHLAKSEQGRLEIARKGGITPLVGLLRTGSEQQMEVAADLIQNLAKNESIRVELVRVGSVPLLKKLNRRGSESGKVTAKRALKQLDDGSCVVM